MTTTARTTPTGDMLEYGYQTLIAFAADADIDLWEKSVQPPGVDVGDAIDITTQHNDTWRTSAPRALLTLMPISITVAYDPAVYDQIIAIIGDNGWITIHFPDGSTLDFVGFLKSFVPGELSEDGGHPTATCEIVPTNVLTGTETEPVYTAPSP